MPEMADKAANKTFIKKDAKDSVFIAMTPFVAKICIVLYYSYTVARLVVRSS